MRLKHGGDTADTDRPGLLARLKARILPQMPDFYTLLVSQCSVTCNGTARLLQFLQEGDPEIALDVRRLEHEGDRVRAKNLATLHRSFATPMDREDFYDAIMAIDEILNYAKTSVREMDILEVTPDEQMIEMAAQVSDGAQALLLGFQQLAHDPVAANHHAEKARKTERRVEKRYRRALATLFDAQRQAERLRNMNAAGPDTEQAGERSADMLVLVTEMLKRREIYRHLSNASDHVAHAAQILQDIINKAN